MADTASKQSRLGQTLLITKHPIQAFQAFMKRQSFRRNFAMIDRTKHTIKQTNKQTNLQQTNN
jgi:hypothetical protein